MNTTARHLGRLIILALSLCLTTACSEKNESVEPVTPPTPTGNKFTVSAEGGTVETGDIAIQIPTGTFEGETAVYIDKVEAGTVFNADAEVSAFYKLTLPATTTKPMRVSLKSNRATDDCVMMVRSAGRVTSGGEQLDYCVPLEEGTSSNGVFSAEIPVLEGGEGNAEVTVGLITTESAEAATRTGDTYSDITVMLPYANRSIKVEVTSQLLYYDVAKTRILREKLIPQALHKLDSIGFRIDADRETIPIEIVAYWKNENRTGLWGQHICSKLTKHWDCVQINGEKLVNMTTQAQQDELAKTLIHELGHYFQTDYDKRRSQWDKATESPGAYYALMEASSVWTEHFFGSPLSSIVVDNGIEFLSAGLWNCSDDKYDSHGYGMSVLFTYLAQQYGDLSIISIFDSYKAGKDADVCLTDYAKKHNFRIDDIEWYNDFLRATAEGHVIAGYDMGGQTRVPLKVNDGSPQVKNLTINRYGMSVQSLYIFEGADIEGKQLTLSESEEGTYTEVYRADFHNSNTPGVLSTISNLSYLGRVNKNASLEVTDSLDKLFKQQRLFFVTLQDPTVSHKVSVPSALHYQLSNPVPTLTLDIHELSFEGNGGEQTVGVTTNQETVSVSTTAGWLDATYDADKKKITVKAEKNTGDVREAYVIARVHNGAGDVEQTIHVQQAKIVKNDYAAGIVIVKLNQDDELAIPSLGGRPAAGTTTVNDDGSFTFTSSGSDSTDPKYLDIPGMGWTLTMITKSTWNITINAVNRGGRIIIQSGSASQTFLSQSITHKTATGDYVNTQTNTYEMSFSFSNITEPAILTTGFNDTCRDWFSYDAWSAKAATANEFGQYVQNFKHTETNYVGTQTEKTLSDYGGRNLVITVGLWEDDHIHTPAGGTQ